MTIFSGIGGVAIDLSCVFAKSSFSKTHINRWYTNKNRVFGQTLISGSRVRGAWGKPRDTLPTRYTDPTTTNYSTNPKIRPPRNGNEIGLKFGQNLVEKLQFREKSRLKSICIYFKDWKIVQKSRDSNKINWLDGVFEKSRGGLNPILYSTILSHI